MTIYVSFDLIFLRFCNPLHLVAPGSCKGEYYCKIKIFSWFQLDVVRRNIRMKIEARIISKILFFMLNKSSPFLVAKALDASGQLTKGVANYIFTLISA